MRWNVLVLHAEATHGREDGVHVDPAEWDYVALGGEHRARKVEQRVRYSGSLERVALDPWDEATDEKGFLTVDLERGQVAFHPIQGRPVVALAPVKVGRGDPERLRRRVREVTAEVPGGIGDKIVRLRLRGATPLDLLALQGEPLRDLRGNALHLTVEADKELRVPAEAWLPGEAPQALRDAVRAELDRDGVSGREIESLLERAVPDAPAAPARAQGDLDALDGDLPGLGRVSTSIPCGLTAILGGGGRTRRAVAELLTQAGRTGPGGAVQRLWVGAEPDTLDDAVRQAIEAVAEARGLDLVDAALDRLGARRPDESRASGAAPDRDGGPAERPGAGAVRVDPEQVAAEFRSAERDLRAHRADVAEVDGDLEVATMDWLRERQDAETTLQAYRDRARELRSRLRRLEAAGPEAPCPTCGRTLQSHYDEVLTELRDEWESVVQDGSWWRSRWEQLELKPAHLQELEGRSLRLHAALEAGSERVELLRARLGELERTVVREGDSDLAGPEGAVITALRRVRTARSSRASDMVLDRGSRFVNRITGGRVIAMSSRDGTVHLEGSEGVVAPLTDEDTAAAKIAVRLAAASLIAAGGRVLASLPIDRPFDRLDEEARIRTLVLSRKLLRVVPRIVLVTRGEAVDARPELFDYVLEAREEGTLSGPVLRPAAAGPGRVSLKAVVPRTARGAVAHPS
jgi:hypothetical protein